jgi:Ca-activated chloride channel family protein
MIKRIGVIGLIGVLAAAFCAAQMGTPVPPAFRSDVRLVEVYATVFDQRGRPVTGLTRENFEVADNGEPQPILSFESSDSELSCAILLDTTGSMIPALPAVKNAVTRLIGELGENDWIAVYGFSASLRLLQDFTRDKSAAKRAVLGIRTGGSTALFDAVAQVALDLSRRKGKKAIIAFTDGDDNSSYLNATVALARVRKVGVPLYTVAEGEALQSQSLLQQLVDISKRTGGFSYAAKKSRDVEDIFQGISRDLNHTYMLAYTAPQANNDKWRSIHLIVKGPKGYKVRAKEGYEPN